MPLTRSKMVRACAVPGALLACLTASNAARAQGTTTYGYDALGRLVSVNNSIGLSTTYTYDAAGNRTAQTITATLPISRPAVQTVPQNSVNNPINFLTASGSPALLGAPATSILLQSAPYGSVSGSGSMNIRYTPPTGYVGPDAFWYQAANAAGQSLPSMVSITVVQGVPAAAGVTQVVAKDSQGNLINFYDINGVSIFGGGTPTSFSVVSAPSHGTVSVSGGALRYTPAANYAGSDQFTYRATNNAGSSDAPVTLTVNNTPSIWTGSTWSVVTLANP